MLKFFYTEYVPIAHTSAVIADNDQYNLCLLTAKESTEAALGM